ncbi:MAG: Crp/Fnr family transcriptional regulator [Bacteroidia bacterium]|nr:Crp/Fnr family transcriptional regulator [Bacteroidia bacterium]
MHPLLQILLSKFDTLTPAEAEAIAVHLPVQDFKKGQVLLSEGQVPDVCYFVLKGCVRQYQLLDGEEKTTAFFTEDQAVADFSLYTQQLSSPHYWVCLEDCSLLAGRLDIEQEMYARFPKLLQITRHMMEQDFGRTRDDFTAFILLSPEERYLNLLQKRPDLLQRAPQHQIASYLGITPESLSRIRKRISQKK